MKIKFQINNILRIIVIATTLFLYFIASSIIYAQEDPSTPPTPTEEVSDEGRFQDAIELELIQQIQDPENLDFEYVLRVRSLINTDRLRIRWDIVEGAIQPAEGVSLSDSLRLEEGEEIIITKEFLPVRSGQETIEVTAVAFGVREDYFSFTETTFIVNGELEIATNRPEFVEAKNIKSILETTKRVLFVVNITLITMVVIWRFKKWLDNE